MTYNVLIVAAGKGSRLEHVLQGLPKCLVPVAGKAAIIRQWEYWSRQYGFGKMALITHSADLVRRFLHDNGGLDEHIDIISHELHDGSANAILKAPVYMLGHPAIIHWCDVLLQYPWFPDELGNLCVAKDGYGRYAVRDGEIVAEANGNVSGIYSMRNFATPTSTKFKPGTDFADVSEFFGYSPNNWEELHRDDLVNFGDEDQLHEADGILPFYNTSKDTELGFDGRFVRKKGAIHESAWYLKAERNGVRTPYLGNHGDDIVLRNIELGTAWQNPYCWAAANRLQQVVCEAMRLDYKIKVDYDAMIFDKSRRRFTTSMSEISGISRSAYLTVVEQCTSALQKLTGGKEHATEGHFDLQFDNILCDASGLYPIDPGGSTFTWAGIGPMGYEKGKMLYGYYTWSHLYRGRLDSGYRSANAEPIEPPDWLMSDRRAKLWCAAHLLAAPCFFKADVVRLRYATLKNMTIAQELIESCD